jgi:pimeloyl-ACP methyl ester carboxylesterase
VRQDANCEKRLKEQTMKLRDLMDALLEVCNTDREFLDRSRYVEGNVRLGIDQSGFVLQFSGGRLAGIVSESSTIRWEYEVFGPESDWNRIWRGELSFVQSTHPLHGSIRVRGDIVKYASEIETIAHLTRLMCKTVQKVEGSVLPSTPPREDRPAPWVARHEVIGRYVDVDGIRTYYESIGKKSSLSFLGIHSAGRDCRQWQQMGDVLGDVGELYAADLPGHGKSWPVPGLRCFMSADEIANFLWSFRNAARIKGRLVVLGCSLGGNLVFQLAAEHPEEVVALVSLEGADFTPEPPESSLVLMDHPRVNPVYSHGEQSRAVTGRRAASPQVDYLNWDVRRLSSVTLRADLTAYSKFDFRNRMHEVRCPALLIRGQDDFLVTAKRVEETAKRLSNSKAVEVVMPEGMGHYAHVEQPVENAKLVMDFLARHGIR